MNRTPVHAPRPAERKPAPAIHRNARTAAAAPSVARALQQRLGNEGTKALVTRAVRSATATPPPASPVALEERSPKAAAPVSAPGSVAEKVAPKFAGAKMLAPGGKAAPADAARGAIPEKEAPKSAGTKTPAPGTKVALSGAGGTPPPASPTAPGKPAGKTATEAPGQSAAKGAKPAARPAGKEGAPAAEVPSASTALAPAVQAVQRRASRSRKHGAPSAAVASAQGAARTREVEQKRGAATETVRALDGTKAEKVSRDEFKAKLKQAIEEATPKPKTEAQAEQVMQQGATQASGALRGTLATERDAAAGPLKSAASTETDPSTQPPPPDVKFEMEPVGPPPAPVSAAPVVPAPLPPERLDYSSDRAPTDQAMAENNVTEDQMQNAKDPAFGPALQSRSTAEKHEAAAEAKYRQGESKVQDQAQAKAVGTLSKDLAGMHGVREQQVGKVVGQQQGTKTKDALERQRITDTITGIKNKTRTDVEAILSSMETEASDLFEKGLKRAEEAYEKAFEEAKGGIGTWLTTWGDDWKEHIENSLGTARAEYMRMVDTAINDVAALVDDKLKAAKQRVADGRKEVENFVNGLETSVKQFGEEALQAVSEDFDTMTSQIDERRDGLINKLMEQYKASYERMSAMEEKLREANKSLWERVYDATVGLIKKIIEFKNLLLSVLAKAAAVVLDIIAHPIRFLGNLVSGVMQGLKSFMSKIGTYLLKGLMDWLFGALAGAGLQLPEKFDLQGIISIVLQILGLTYANFRARAVAIVGEPVVAAIEKTAEVFKVIITEGVPGLWRFIKEQLANLKSMVLDAIFNYIKEKVIIAGITWIIGLLNPASAFFKACKAIYDIIVFFVTRGRQILDLVNAIVDSVAAIASGSVGVAAAKVEAALAKAIPVAIGFLAGLLGLGDPSKPVKEFIEKARAPVNKAIDWVINMAVKAVKGVIGLAKTGVKAVGKALRWAFATTTFKDADGKKHTVSVSDAGVLTIESTPQAAREFVAWYAKEKKIDAAKVKPIYELITQADKVVLRIQKSKTTVDDIPSPAAQKELLALSTQISALIANLVSGDPKLGKLKEKYLLEGQVGTYATVPKAVGDQLTPDHQPQASVILAAADFFKSSLGIAGGDLAARAKSRAAQGYAINLHFRRHVEGATYGSKGKTQEGFHSELQTQAGGLKKDAAKAKVADLLRIELKKDVKKMKDVAQSDLKDKAWQQLREESVKEAGGDEKVGEKNAKELKKEIADRIISGENQIASQPLDF